MLSKDYLTNSSSEPFKIFEKQREIFHGLLVESNFIQAFQIEVPIFLWIFK